MDTLPRDKKMMLLALRQGGDFTGRLRRRPLDLPEFGRGLVGFALILAAAYAALWLAAIIEALP